MNLFNYERLKGAQSKRFSYNKTVQRFLTLNSIDPNFIAKNVDVRTQELLDQSIIMANYYILKDIQYERNVSIGDIYGFAFEKGNIYKMLNYFFDVEGDDYLCRSCHQLSKSSNMMLQSKSFTIEPMVLICLRQTNDMYFIFLNGRHRFLALKSLYLKELADNFETVDTIKEKYTVPASVYDIDMVKTFCNFIIQVCQKGYIANISSYDMKNILAENFILTEEDLLEYTKELYYDNSSIFDEYLETDNYFSHFVENYIYSKGKQKSINFKNKS